MAARVQILKRYLQVFLISWVIAFVFAFATPNLIHRHEFDRAFSAYMKEPNLANKAELNRQSWRNIEIMTLFDGLVAVPPALLLTGIFAVLVLRRQYTAAPTAG